MAAQLAASQEGLSSVSKYCSTLTASQFVLSSKCYQGETEGYATHMGETRNAYKITVIKREGKRALGRPKRKWDGVNMDFTEIGYESVYFIYLAPDKDKLWDFVNMVMNLRCQ
jgi:hypothetical protein